MATVKIPENLQVALPLDICKDCKCFKPKIEYLYCYEEAYLSTDYYELTCEFESGCKYAFYEGTSEEKKI